jgi:hypothetical protein
MVESNAAGWPIIAIAPHSDPRERPLSTDSVEKVDLLLGLRQNQVIGQWEDSQHDGTIVERTRETVLLVQH